MRESPAVVLMEKLREIGANIDYSDPHIPIFPKIREHKFDLLSVELTPKTISKYDILLLTTNHSAFDYDMIQKYAKLVLDTRGVYQNETANIVKA